MITAVGIEAVTDADFDERVLKAGLPVLVEFTADWCGPCRQIEPVLAAVAAKQAGRLEVVRLDVDANQETAVRYGVLSMPTLMVFHGGEPVKAMVGARPERRLLEELADVV